LSFEIFHSTWDLRGQHHKNIAELKTAFLIAFRANKETQYMIQSMHLGYGRTFLLSFRIYQMTTKAY
jgi:hypothetical protein